MDNNPQSWKGMRVQFLLTVRGLLFCVFFGLNSTCFSRSRVSKSFQSRKRSVSACVDVESLGLCESGATILWDTSQDGIEASNDSSDLFVVDAPYCTTSGFELYFCLS